MKAPLIGALLAGLMTSSCGNNSQSTAAPSTTTTTTTTSPTTETFSSVLGIHGTTSHAFTISKAGTITATLTSVGPPAVAVGLGIGIPIPGVPCSLAVSVNAIAGSSAQVSSLADQGRYCVQIYDLGNVSDPVAFSMTIEHP
jgi:hypothetical protein